MMRIIEIYIFLCKKQTQTSQRLLSVRAPSLSGREELIALSSRRPSPAAISTPSADLRLYGASYRRSSVDGASGSTRVSRPSAGGITFSVLST